MQTIEVCGRNNNHALREKSNHKTHDGGKYISPAFKTDLDPSTITSYSVYNKTVVVNKKGEALAIGDNSKLQISGSLPKRILSKFTEANLKDGFNEDCKAISAVCGTDYTLYLISTKNESCPKQLAYAHTNLDREYPVILNIGNVIPLSIYGGYSDCAAITTVGSIIYIHEALYQSISTKIEAVSLPGNENAVSVACCYSFVIALGSGGHIYAAKKGPTLVFTEVTELKGKVIKSISGIYHHCFAVTNEGKVYVRGSDISNCGCLGLGKKVKSADTFTEVKLLSKYKIDGAYAGTYHSIFKTTDGNLIGCGENKCGQIMQSEGPGKENIYKPVETTVTDAKFCILGDCNTVICKGDELPMRPNKEIKSFN